MMRSLCSILLLAACGADVQEPDAPASMRERLAAGPTLLEVSVPDSTGAVTAARKTSDGWVPGLADLRIDAGELVLSGEGDVVTVEELRLEVGPIAIPESVLGYPLELTDITLSAMSPVTVIGAWSGDDVAHGDATIELLLEWSLVNHGTTSPLGSPDLPALPLAIELSGSGEQVRAEVAIRAPGELWKWANVFRLEDLELAISAAE